MLPIEFRSNGSQVSGVMWTLAYSKSAFSAVSISAGNAAAGASKSVDCRDAGNGSITCLAWGLNTTSIPDGQVATATLRVSDTASGSSAPVSVVSTSAVSPAADPVASTGAGGSVTFDAPRLSTLSCSPSSLRAPASSQCTVTLTAAAASAAAVSLGYSASNAAVSMPSTVTVPSGAATAQFTMRVDSAASSTTVQLSASAGGVTKQFAVSVTPPVSVSVSPASATLTAGEERQQFAATVSWSSDTSVTWTVSPALGTISSSGLYTSPPTVSSAQTVTIRATSRADASKSATATVVVNPDRTAPVISAVTATPGTTSATITWTTNERSTTRIDYGPAAALMNSRASSSDLVSSHSITVSGLVPGTTYYFRVTSADASGNTTVHPAAGSAPATFKTRLLP
jgi:hypothetical protein